MVVNNRIWIVGSVMVMVIVVLLGWFLGAAPRLDEAKTNELNRQAAETQNQAYEAALAALKEDYENIDEFRATLDELQEALPSSSRLSRFIGSLRDLEIASGVVLQKFSASDAKPFVYRETLEDPAAPAAPAAEAEAEEGSTAEVPVVETPVGPEPELVQTLSPEEFIYIAVSLDVSGSIDQILTFVAALQAADRRFLVTDISYQADPSTPGMYSGKVNGYLYVLLDPTKPPVEDEDEDVSLDDPQPAPSPTPSSSPSPSGSPTP